MKSKIIIIGAGGHGKEVAQILSEQHRDSSQYEVFGFIDENKEIHGKKINGVLVLGGISWIEENKSDELKAICAVGNPKIMRLLSNKIKSLGIEFTNAIHPNAYIAPNSEIGKGVMIFQNTSISVNVKIGDFVTINVNSSISHDTIIENYANINPKVAVAGNVKIGESSFIGMGSSVIQGVTIGSFTTLGAGSIVVKDIPSNVLALGVPAQTIKTIE
jgi:sugar O-acyltransferase (sialic acid O-acetyltransferase NeuD family)